MLRVVSLVDKDWPHHSHWVQGPENQGKDGERSKKLGSLVTLGPDGSASVNGDVPDDEQIRDATNGIPTPFLNGRLMAKCGDRKSVV